MLIGIADWAKQAGCCAQTARKMCEEGKIPAVRVGNRWKIDPEKAQKALECAEEERLKKRNTPRSYATKRKKASSKSGNWFLDELKSMASVPSFGV